MPELERAPCASRPAVPELSEFYAAKQARVHAGAHVYARHAQIARALRHCAPAERRTLLDIGCGEGAAASYLARSLGCGAAYGIEIAADSAERANERGVIARACNVDDGPLPYPDGMFDVVLCSEVIEHVLDTDHLLDEIARVLEPGGVAALTTPNLASWVNRLTMGLAGWQPFTYDVSLRHKVGRPTFGSQETSGHLHMFTHRAFRELLERHGYELLAIEGIPANDPPIADADGRPVTHQALPLYARALYPLDSLLANVPALAFGLLAIVRRPAGQRA